MSYKEMFKNVDRRGKTSIYKEVEKDKFTISSRSGNFFSPHCSHVLEKGELKNLKNPCPRCKYYGGMSVIEELGQPVKRSKNDESVDIFEEEDLKRMKDNMSSQDYFRRYEQLFQELNIKWDNATGREAIQYLHYYFREFILFQQQTSVYDQYQSPYLGQYVENQRVIFPPRDSRGDQQYFIKVIYLSKESYQYKNYIDQLKTLQDTVNEANKLGLSPRVYLTEGISVRDIRNDKGYIFVYQVFSYVEGRSLREVVEGRPEAANLFERVFSGIEKLHSNQLVHGNLNVDSIWVQELAPFMGVMKYQINFMEFTISKEKSDLTMEQVFGRINLSEYKKQKSAQSIREVFIGPLYDHLTLFYNFFSTLGFSVGEYDEIFYIFMYRYVLRIYSQRLSFEKREDVMFFERATIVDVIMNDVFRSSISLSKVKTLMSENPDFDDTTYGIESLVEGIEEKKIPEKKFLKQLFYSAFVKPERNRDELTRYLELFVGFVLGQ